ncbi:hypothetical protein B0T20DRAFT_492636 [Sordaria brevicollis]|uniref:RING-type domain-containing protein n=1 Tax=Sordaria brevicollis TaxID=83679 RepID=A0AAE0PKP3_SORBR|nr:hypothetical protein B0T20DRAFT_492636 [Sordaria brevicollis]
MSTVTETFFPNIRRYLSLPASEQAKVPTPKPECSICMISTLKCYPLNNYGPLVTECPETKVDLERMVVLYCGHVVGYDCIRKYLRTCYRNFNQDKRDENLPRCPCCRDVLTSDCDRPFAQRSTQYFYVNPLIIAPAGPPVEGREDGPGEKYKPENPVDFRLMDESLFCPIAFTFNDWKNMPYTQSEGGILPKSCRVCERDIYDDAVRRYQEQRVRILARLQREQERERRRAEAEAEERAERRKRKNAIRASQRTEMRSARYEGVPFSDGPNNQNNKKKEKKENMAYKTVQIPRESIYDETPARPRQMLWPLGYCVMTAIPLQDGSGTWTQLRIRVATRTVYKAVMDDGVPVEIPLEPKCFGPPQFGPMRFGRHPVPWPEIPPEELA